MENFFVREFKPKTIIDNPSEEKLREWALERGGVITEFGNLAVITTVRNRIAKFTEVVTGELRQENLELLHRVFNTGKVGGAERGQKITHRDSLKVLEMIARDRITWKKDEFWGYEVPVEIPGVDLGRFDLNSYYTEEQVQELSEELKRERLEWLSQFSGLNPDIIKAVGR